MGDPTSTEVVPRTCVNRARLEARLASDRYDLSEHPDDAHAHGWVAAMRHVQHVILPSLDEHERLLDALRELHDAPREMDLRLRDALILGTSDEGSAPFSSPAVAHDSSLVCQHAAGRAQEPALLDEALVFDERVLRGEFDLSDAEVA